MRHPISPATKLALLSYFAFWDRFIYYGTFTIIILYLTDTQHMTGYTAYGIWGLFAALGFTTPVIGGILGDRWINRDQAIMYGSICLFVASVLIALFKGPIFLVGIACLLCGLGLVKSNVATLAGTLKLANTSSSGNYNFYFIGMVLGATLGPAVFGIFFKHQLWDAGFIVTAVGALSTLMVGSFLLQFKLLRKENISRSMLTIVGIVIATFLVSLLFKYTESGQFIIAAIIILVLIYLLVVCLKSSVKDRLNIMYLVIVSLFCMAHLLGSFQTDGLFTAFIQHHLKHDIFGWQVPTLEFSSIEPITAAIFSPILGLLWLKLERNKNLKISAHLKVLLGTLCSVIAFASITYASSSESLVQGDHTIWFLVSSNVLIGIGDALIIPTLMAAVSFFSPKLLQGTLMGFWFMSDALAGLIAGILVQPTHKTHALMNVQTFHHSFQVILIVLLATSLLLLVCLRGLGKLIK